jgi:uroporphyrinogen-III decarboxylase
LGQSSKQLVKNLFEGKDTSQIPFIPWISSFAAKLEQVPVQKMLSDPGILSKALINSQKLFGYDAIINIFDPGLEAEACGCKLKWPDNGTLPVVASHPLNEGLSIADMDIAGLEKKGRLPVVIEATKRLNIIKGKDVAIACLVTGPLTLAGHLKGQDILADLRQNNDEALEIIETTGSIVLNLCRVYCELGVDLIVIVEELFGQASPEVIQAVASPLHSLWNVVKYYNVHSIILSKGCRKEHLEPICSLGPDGVAISGDFSDKKLGEIAKRFNCYYACNIPLPSLSGTEFLADCLSNKNKGYFLSTNWEIPYTTNVNDMHEIMRIIRDVRRS